MIEGEKRHALPAWVLALHFFGLNQGPDGVTVHGMESSRHCWYELMDEMACVGEVALARVRHIARSCLGEVALARDQDMAWSCVGEVALARDRDITRGRSRSRRDVLARMSTSFYGGNHCGY